MRVGASCHSRALRRGTETETEREKEREGEGIKLFPSGIGVLLCVYVSVKFHELRPSVSLSTSAQLSPIVLPPFLATSALSSPSSPLFPIRLTDSLNSARDALLSTTSARCTAPAAAIGRCV